MLSEGKDAAFAMLSTVQLNMVLDGAYSFTQRYFCWCFSGERLFYLLKDPGITKRTAPNSYAITAGLCQSLPGQLG